MSARLTLNEFEFLKKALRCLEDTGHAWFENDSGKEFDAKVIFFGASRKGIIDTTAKVQILREKIQKIAGE